MSTLRAAPTPAAHATALQAQALGAHLPPLLVAAERIAATVAQGVHGRRRVGAGDSFWQFRPLLPGEPATRIDWRRSARSDRGHFVRQTEWEAAQTVALWHARGPGMRWSSLPALPQKQARAELLLLALAALLLRGGERVRLLGTGEPDATSAAGLARLATALLALAPGPEHGPAHGPAHGPEHGALPAADAVPRHGGVVLIGDFLEPLEAVRATLGAMAARAATGVVLQVLDPAEVALPWLGRVRFTPPARGGPSALLGRAEAAREPYAQRLAEHRDGLATICRAAGLRLLLHQTDHPPAAALLALHMALAPAQGAAVAAG